MARDGPLTLWNAAQNSMRARPMVSSSSLTQSTLHSKVTTPRLPLVVLHIASEVWQMEEGRARHGQWRLYSINPHGSSLPCSFAHTKWQSFSACFWNLAISTSWKASSRWTMQERRPDSISSMPTAGSN